MFYVCCLVAILPKLLLKDLQILTRFSTETVRSGVAGAGNALSKARLRPAVLLSGAGQGMEDTFRSVKRTHKLMKAAEHSQCEVNLLTLASEQCSGLLFSRGNCSCLPS